MERTPDLYFRGHGFIFSHHICQSGKRLISSPPFRLMTNLFILRDILTTRLGVFPVRISAVVIQTCGFLILWCPQFTHAYFAPSHFHYTVGASRSRS
jgi:hypothetical protein